MATSYDQAQIVLVDPESASINTLAAALAAAGYPTPRGVTDPGQARTLLEASEPDLVVIDISVVASGDIGPLANLLSGPAPESFVPVLAVGYVIHPQDRQRAIEAGARDFLPKPIDLEEFLLHVHSLLDTRFVHCRLRETRNLLEELVKRRTSELRQAQLETLEILGRVAEVRDDITGEHTRRVGRLSGLLAQELGVPTAQAKLIMRAAPLHDLGKVAISDRVLLKSGAFEDDERSFMREHAALGAELLADARSELLRLAAQIAIAHHERWDGHGYPAGLASEAIPLPARIVAVADAFDAMTHARPYKDAWPPEDALAELERERGWQFDPRVVDALVRLHGYGRLDAAAAKIPRRTKAAQLDHAAQKHLVKGNKKRHLSLAGSHAETGRR